MAALKSNNVEEYMRLVQGAKNSKIDQLLTQVSSELAGLQLPAWHFLRGAAIAQSLACMQG